MKRFKTLLFIMIATFFTLHLSAQSIGDYIDVVFLKNGSIIKGIIIEQVPGQTLRIQTSDGSQFVYAISEIEKYGRELKPGASITASSKPSMTPKTPKEPKPFYAKKKGYFAELTFLGGKTGGGFRVTNGIRFGRFGNLGIALGFEALNTNNNNYRMIDSYQPYGYNQFGMSDKSPFATVNLVYSGEILNRRITPFYQLELGYGFNLMPWSDQYYEYYDDMTGQYNGYYYSVRNYGGPMGGAAFGVKFYTQKKVNFKLAFDARFHTNISDPAGGVMPYGGYNYGTTSSGDAGMGIRFGIGF